jgi:hypothetical protein
LEGCGTCRYQQLASTGDGDRCWCAGLLGGELPTCSARLAAAIATHGHGKASGAELIGDLLDALRRGLLPRGMRNGIHGDQVHMRAAPPQQ